MKSDFEEELTKLIEQAHQAGYIYACWSDGVPELTNDKYDKSEEDLKLAIKQFAEKYDK
jgi:hypothetical protein